MTSLSGRPLPEAFEDTKRRIRLSSTRIRAKDIPFGRRMYILRVSTRLDALAGTKREPRFGKATDTKF